MFTQEELIALKNIISYASETLSLEDEPLLKWLYDRVSEKIEV